MPIWRLTPIHPNHEDWQGSHHTGPLLVRAATSERARDLAAKELGQGQESAITDHRPITLRSPWDDPSLTSCTREEGSQHPEDGPDAILWPAGDV